MHQNERKVLSRIVAAAISFIGVISSSSICAQAQSAGKDSSVIQQATREKLRELGIEEIRTDEFEADVQAMKKDYEELSRSVREAQKRGSNMVDSAERAAASLQEKRATEKAVKAALALAEEDKAELKTRMKEYEAAALELVDKLNSRESDYGFLKTLEEILRKHPEILKKMPDAWQRLHEMEGATQQGGGSVSIVKNSSTIVSYVFISQSMGEVALEEIFKMNANRKDVTYVIQGVPKGMDISRGILWLQKLAAKFDPPPNIVLDPKLFEAYGVTLVPTVVLAREDDSVASSLHAKSRKYGEMLAKVTGLASDEWIRRRLEVGEKGDLGVQGQTFGIAEPNLIDEIKRRIALVDWDKHKREALARYWERRVFDVLPTAAKDTVRVVDPTIFVERDIRDLSGRIIRAAGDKVNPLDIRPFTREMIIFNGASEDEIERVKTYLAKRKAAKSRLVLIATAIDRSRGWDAYKELTDGFDAHVFFLTPEIKERWQIQATPSVVTADNDKKLFLVEELGPAVSDQAPQAEAIKTTSVEVK